MGVFDQELILPGTITEIMSDYSYGYDTSKFGTTDSVTIIGTAFNGPVGKPVEIYSPEHARYIFGETYDSKTRREATLVAEIQDAWDRGCRTIYAVRVSGKDIYKDFQFAINTKLKLRIAGIFPSNDNKDIYMVYEDTVGDAKIKFYKPAKRATIQEKMQGLIDKEDSILVTTLDITGSYGMSKDSRLVELIKLINEHRSNNILRLSIVDENGNDVTISSKEAQGLSVGAMFAGAYLIGRDKNNAVATTNLAYVFADATHKPYEEFDGTLYKELIINTDINQDLPIFAKTLDELNQKFIAAGVSMATMFDILTVPGKIDLVYEKNKLDYEEVDITDFDLYKRLGSGFAIAAKADFTKLVYAEGERRDIKVREAAIADTNRVQPLTDGIYSMLENLKSDYRILANGNADLPINGKLPKKAEFEIAVAKDIKIFDGKVIARAKVDKADKFEAKKYRFVLDRVVDSSYGQADVVKPALYIEKTVKRVAGIAALTEVAGKSFPNGTLFMMGATLYRFENGNMIALNDATVNVDLIGKLFMVGTQVFKGVDAAGVVQFVAVDETEFGTKKFVLVESAHTVAVYEMVVTPETIIPGTPEQVIPAVTDPDTGDVITPEQTIPATPDTVVPEAIAFEPVGSIVEVFSDNDNKNLVTVQSEYLNTNTITIKSDLLDYTTLEEYVEMLNADQDLSLFFEFVIDPSAALAKDEYVSDPMATTPLIAVPTAMAAVAEKEVTYDVNLYVPYKTTDNFARHLAQHCTYTSLKTAPTHGIIGCSKLMDVNLNSVARKVDALMNLDLNLYAKKSNGRDMLDRNNLPYPIGRNISVTVGQYVVATSNGYNYISNMASGYSGMVSVLPLDQSSTNQSINIPTPMYELTTFQLERLTQKGFVTVKQSYTKGFVVTDGVTMAPVDSSFRRLQVNRIVAAVEEIIRAAAEPFIGKQNHLSNRNSIQTAIKSGLEKLKGKLLEDFDFKVIIEPGAMKLGIINIDYTLVPIYEIREVRNRISVKETL